MTADQPPNDSANPENIFTDYIDIGNTIISAKTNARNLSLDFLKGISIMLVVFFHNARLNPDSFVDSLWMLACHAAVPCFFMVSGAVFFQKPFNMKRHLLRIVKTYLTLVAWRGIYLLIYGLWKGAGYGGSMRSLLSYLFTFGSIDAIPTGLFWFMEALLVVLLLAPILNLCRSTSRTVTLYIMGVLFLFNQLLNDGQFLLTLLSQAVGRTVWNIGNFGAINPFNTFQSNYILYFLLGAELMELKDRLNVIPDVRTWRSFRGIGGHKASIADEVPLKTSFSTAQSCHSQSSLSVRFIIPSIMVVIGLACLTIIRYLQCGTFRWNGTQIVSGYYWCSTMVLSCGIFLMVCQIPVGTVPVLRWFSRNVGAFTMGIFFLHTPLFTLMEKLVLTPLDPLNGWVINLLESCLITAIACAVTWLGRRIPLLRLIF